MNNRLATIRLTAAIILCAVQISPSSAHAKYYSVEAGGYVVDVNTRLLLRSGPGTGYRLRARMPDDSCVGSTHWHQGTWHQVMYRDRRGREYTGWASEGTARRQRDKYLQPVSECG